MESELIRTLVRVFEHYPLTGMEVDSVYFIVPAFDPEEKIKLTNEQIPSNIVQRISEGQTRFHARVNIGAEDKADLVFAGWEEN